MSFSKLAYGLIACAVLAGCSSNPEEPVYGFGESDMQGAILGDWSGNLTLSGQSPTTFTMNIVQVPTLQPACGNRTFNAPLCIESTSMSVEATLTTADKAFDSAKLAGTFDVFGLELQQGELYVMGNGVTLAGQISIDKSAHDLTISGSQSGSATMQR